MSRIRTGASSALLALVSFVAFFSVFFLPATFGKLMASGDAVNESIPAIRGAHHLWESAIFIGYQMYADPNQQLLYPLAWLASTFNAYNAFAVAPFVIAAFGMWGFVRASTRSVTAATVSAFVYALGGFMISHAGHLMITHPAAWVPYMLWSLELQRRKRATGAVAMGAVAIGLCAVSGQPEVLAFAVPILVLFVVASAKDATVGTVSYIKRCALTIVLGFGIGAIQLIPEAVLAQSSTRSSLDFASFVFLKIPLAQLLTKIAFPYASGVSILPGFTYSHTDVGAFTEDTLSVGLIALILAAVGVIGYFRDWRVVMWAIVAFAGLVLALGDATPLAAFTYHLPVYSLLRIPGRHAFEWTLAIAVLSGYGVTFVQRSVAASRIFLIALAVTIAITIGGYLQFTQGASSNAAFVAQTVAAPISLVSAPWVNGALGYPLASAVLGTCLLACAFLVRKTHRVSKALIIAAVLQDVGAFAYPAYWNWAAVTENALAPTTLAETFQARKMLSDTRVAWAPGNADFAAFPPNDTLLWNVPTVDGYTPLVPQRIDDLLGTTPGGGVAIPASRDTAMDLAGVSLLAAPLAGAPQHMFFSFVHPKAAVHADFALPKPVSATTLTLISDLGESMDVPQNAVVGTFTIVFSDHRVEKHDIRAGRDTSEFAYDRPDVLPQMKHRRATVYTSLGPGHTYVSKIPIASMTPIDHVAFDWRYPTAAFTLEQLSLEDTRTSTTQVFNILAGLYAFKSHWKPVDLGPSVNAFANEQVMPRAWIAKPIVMTEAQAAFAIHNGVLPDKSQFVPHRQALIEEPEQGASDPLASDSIQKITEGPYAMQFSATCAKSCVVVTRDAFSNDWRATIDDKPAKLFVTDVDLRGVVMPSGKHLIGYRFVPMPLFYGVAAAVASILVLALLSLREGRRRRR